MSNPRLDLVASLLCPEEPVIVLRPGAAYPVELFDRLKRFTHLLGAGIKLMIVPQPGSFADKRSRQAPPQMDAYQVSEVFSDPAAGERVVVIRPAGLEDVLSSINVVMLEEGLQTQILVVPQVAEPDPGKAPKNRNGIRATRDVPLVTYPLTMELLQLLQLVEGMVHVSAAQKFLGDPGDGECGWPYVEKRFVDELRPYVHKAGLPASVQSLEILRNALGLGIPRAVMTTTAGDLPHRFILHSWHGVIAL